MGPEWGENPPTDPGAPHAGASGAEPRKSARRAQRPDGKLDDSIEKFEFQYFRCLQTRCSTVFCVDKTRKKHLSGFQRVVNGGLSNSILIFVICATYLLKTGTSLPREKCDWSIFCREFSIFADILRYLPTYTCLPKYRNNVYCVGTTNISSKRDTYMPIWTSMHMQAIRYML